MNYFKIVVEGRGNFPIDMLRHDQCYPATEADSTRINDSNGKRQVELYKMSSNRWWHPTERRWESFGWNVVLVEEVS